jgi:two-component system copper resistance phosphate regulon response regulator CusR
MRLLVAEADVSLAVLLRDRFQQESFTVQVISSAAGFDALATEAQYDLLLLDLNLPDFKRLGGAERSAETLARSPCCAAINRKHGRGSGHGVQCGRRRFRGQTVRTGGTGRASSGHAAAAQPSSSRRLHVRQSGDLPRHPSGQPGRPVSRATIIEQVWRMHSDSITNVVDVYANYLRRKIDAGSDRPLIRTIRGVGYQIGGNHFSD